MKKTNGFGLFGVIVIMLITAITSSIATGVIMLNNSSQLTGLKTNLSNDEDLKQFVEVYETLLAKYYDDIDKKGMLNAAEEGMLNFLGDKYTTYLEDSEYQDLIDDLSGSYEGIGIKIENNKIVGVTPDSPAHKAGLLVNDIILKLNSVDVSTMNGTQIGNLIKNDKSTSVTVEISRNGMTLSFNVPKEKLVNQTISYRILEGTTIGYIAIEKFSENLSTLVGNALKELEGNGMSALVIDVRNNVGGYLSAAEETASLFLEEGKVIYSLQSNNNTYSYKDSTKEKRNYPIAVLINGNSASASEILAAALKDSYNAVLVGSKSYGKGKVQQVITLESGDSVKYTSAKWLTPNGICIDGIGITPDHVIINDESGVDIQLNKAVEVLNGF